MFKLAKYYVLINLYKQSKQNVLIVLAALVLFVILAFIFGDLMLMTKGDEKYILLMVKWIVLLLLIFIAVWNISKALRKVQHPFVQEKNNDVFDVRKEKLMGKKYLQNRSELILNKYRSSK